MPTLTSYLASSQMLTTLFRVPAIGLAMYHMAYFKNKKFAKGMILTVVLTAMLGNITEPLEFTFLFISPLLFAVHAVLAAIEATQAALTTPPAVPPRVITKLAFMNRFTMEELAAIYTAAKTEVMVEVFMDRLKLAEYVDVTDPQTRAGLQALAASGLLTEARVQEVLQ